MPEEEDVHVSPAQWDKRLKKRTRGIYGALIGTGVIALAYVFGRAVLADGDLTMTEAGFLGALVVLGLLAAFPHTFMPPVYRALEAWQGRRGGK